MNARQPSQLTQPQLKNFAALTNVRYTPHTSGTPTASHASTTSAVPLW